jgi:phospholipid-binding lipoprotein MlaA
MDLTDIHPNSARRSPVVAALLAVFALCLAGCATTNPDGSPRERNPDPWEPMNRSIFGFNDAIDRNALRPVAVAYRDHTPELVQTGVGNFYENLGYPTTILHLVLQGKFMSSARATGRFLLNTTLGWGGVIDVASGGTSLPKYNEDSGQTLGWWGVPPGPYLVLPFLGPATVRDAPARVADDFTQPFRWYNADNERWFSLALSLVNTRAGLLPYDRLVREAYDPYVFVRDAWLQRRLYAVFDGNIPARKLGAAGGDDENWAEAALKEDEAAAGQEVAAPPAPEPSPDRR